MEKKKRRITRTVSQLISLTLAFSVCFPFSAVRAEEGEEQETPQEEILTEPAGEETPETSQNEEKEEMPSSEEEADAVPEETAEDTAAEEEVPVSEESGETELPSAEDGRETISAWASLQEAVGSASAGEVIVLSEDLTAAETDSAITVPAGKDVVIDLAGHAVSRNRSGTESAGNVFIVDGKLTVINSGAREDGVVSGADHTDKGGAFLNNGTLILENITVSSNYARDGAAVYSRGTAEFTDCVFSGNTARADGGALYLEGLTLMTNCEVSSNIAEGIHAGGIYVSNGADVTLDSCLITNNEAGSNGGGIVARYGSLKIIGGIITGNRSDYAGGIAYHDGSVITLSGSPFISGNTAVHETAGEDVLVNENAYIRFDGKLGEDARIGVEALYTPSDSRPDPVTLTKGLKGNGTIENFICTDSANMLSYDAEGDIVVGVPRTVSFAAGEGTGSMASETRVHKSFYILPECDFTAPQGKLFSGWQTPEGLKAPGDGITVDGNITVTALWNSSRWQQIQQQIDAAASGDTVTVVYDITASAEDGPLTIPSGKDITLELAGHTIDRALQNPAENGSAIMAHGWLTITDQAGTGRITGGNTTGSGGGIYAERNLTLNGILITGNHADGDGGGIYSADSCNIYLYGTVISGNDAGQNGGGIADGGNALAVFSAEVTDNTAGAKGGGIYIADKRILMQDYVNVSGNSAGGKTDNIWFSSGNYVRLVGGHPLDENTRIGITTEEIPAAGEPIVLSPVLTGLGTIDNFFSDREEYAVVLHENGRAVLIPPVTVTFLPGAEGVSGEMAPVTAGRGISYTLPQCGFDLYGSLFGGWIVNDGQDEYWPGDKITPEGDLTLTATWNGSAWKNLQSRINHAEDGEVIELDQDTIASSADTYLLIPEDKNIILDLNGFELNRNLESPILEGMAVFVNGKLTVRDSGTTGKITGGNNSSNPTTAICAGGIQVSGSGELVLESGSITGNAALGGGGVSCMGKFTMTGGSIHGNNVRALGGGVLLNFGEMIFTGGEITGNNSGYRSAGIDLHNGSLRVSGSPVVKGNTVNILTESNIYIYEDQRIEIAGALSDEAELHVSSDVSIENSSAVTITSGLPGNGTLENFTADRGNQYLVQYDGDGEVLIGKAAEISFLNDRGRPESTMPAFRLPVGSEYTVPDCLFAKPEYHLNFRGWLKNDDTAEYLQPGTVITITGNTVFHAAWINSWEDLQRRIDEADDRLEYKMSTDILAGDKDTSLIIPEGKTLILDLNGFTLSRGLEAPEEGGSVFVNYGTLTIRDSSEAQTGTITGGYSPDQGGGILNYGITEIDSGRISGNKAAGNGGGIYNAKRVLMRGGMISGNEAAGSGGGIYQADENVSGVWTALAGGEISDNRAGSFGGGIYGSGAVNLVTESVIRGNTVNGQKNNLYVSSGRPVTITGTISENTLVGVTAEDTDMPVVVTKGLPGRGAPENFFCDDPHGTIIPSEEGEAQIAAAVIVTFESGREDASGTMEDEKAALGMEYEIPVCRFAVEGQSFNGWILNDDPEQVLKPGDTMIPEEDMKLTALWSGSWITLQKQINEAEAGDVIILENDVTAAVSDVPLTIAAGKNLTIDLNGYTINRNLKEMEENGAVFLIQGELTVTDGSDDQSGLITGGNNYTTLPDGAGTINVFGGKFTLEKGTVSGNHSFNAGAVYVSGGTFTMTGGTITENTARRCAAVVLSDEGIMNMSGGRIIRNTAETGEAIDTAGGTLNISGSPVIIGNTRNGAEMNVLAVRDSLINVTGPLSRSARIGVITTGTGSEFVFTSGLKDRGLAENFVSDREDLTVSLTGEGEGILVHMDKPEFSGHQLVLTGSLGLRFGMKFPEGFDSTGSYMTFKVSGEEQTVNTADAETGNGMTIYTCYLNTLQMAEEIEAVFHYGNQEVTQTYTLADYFEYFDVNAPDFSAKTLNLVKAVADYGYCAQPYLVSANSLEGKYAPITKHYAESYDFEAIKEAVSGYTFAKAISDSAVEKASYKLSLDSDTALTVLMQVPAGTELTASAVFGGKTYTAEKLSDTVYAVKVTGIKASRLGDTITVNGSAEGDFTITVSALSYVRTVLNSSKYNNQAKNTAAALYSYYEAVRAYGAGS